MAQLKLARFQHNLIMKELIAKIKDIDIATGSQESLHEDKRLPIDLIEKYKRDPEVKRLLNMRRKMLGILKELQYEINRALSK